MTWKEFETLKTIIEASDFLSQQGIEGKGLSMEEIKSMEFPNVKDRLLDGENLIDLWVELLEYAYYSDREGNINDFWAYAQEVLVEPDEKTHKEKRFVFALCTPGGSFEDMIILKQSEIISENTDEDDEGMYHLKFQINGEEDSSYFLSKEEL